MDENIFQKTKYQIKRSLNNQNNWFHWYQEMPAETEIELIKQEETLVGGRRRKVDKIVPNTAGNGYHMDTYIKILPDMRQGEPDIPTIDAFVDMGLNEPKDPPRFKMDRMFQEQCTVGQKGLLAFHMKNKLDYQKPYHLRPEIIQKWIGEKACDWLDANSLSQAWEKLDFDATTVKKLVFGYVASDNKWRCGLRKAGRSEALYFEKIVNELEPKDQVTIEQFRIEGYELALDAWKPGMTALQQISLIEAYARAEWAKHLEEKAQIIEYITGYHDENFTNTKEFRHHIVTDTELGDPADHEDLEFEDPTENFGSTGADPVWGAHPLYDGSECLPHEYLSYLNHASLEKLNAEKAKMFPQGRAKKAQYWFFTESQKRQFWQYVKDREEKLFDQAVTKCRDEVIELMRDLVDAENEKERRQLAAMAYTMINGGQFNYFGQTYNFNRASKYEQTCLKLALKVSKQK
jgi:hypothetical protein